MAKLKTTYVSGGLYVTGSGNFVSASEFRGNIIGTASVAQNLDPTANLRVQTLDVSGSAVVGGDLKVLGDLTYVGVKDLRVKDKVIEINTDDSGSAVASADGAGIIIKNSDPEGDISILYDKNSNKLAFNKQIAGKIDEAVKVTQSLTLQLTDAAGTASADVEFDGATAKTFSVDLSGLETKQHASASVADLQDQINAISGESGSGSITERIQAAINELDADVSVAASGTPAHDGVFVLTGIAINEADGKLTSGSVTSVEVEQAGAAAAAKSELLGADTDETSSMTLYGVKKYATAQGSSSVAALSSSVAADIAEVIATQSADSQSISQSIAIVASNALNLVESSSYIAVSAKADNKQTISAKTKEVASASVEAGDGLAVASDVKAYVDSQVGGKNVTAVGDEYVTLNAANNAITGSATIKAIAEATAAKQGLVDAYDAKLHVSASVADLSSSIASTDSAQNDRLDALETASGSAITRLNTLEAATASYANSASVAAIDAAQESRLDALETVTGSLASTYVAKAGDTMTGDLDMGANKIKFGDMWMVWDSTNECINFVAEE